MRSKALTAVFVLTVAVLVLSISSAALASSGTPVLLNGKRINFDNAPVMIDGVMMVEVRPFAEALGFNVKWTQNTQSVKLTNSNTGAVLKIGYDIMTVSDLTGSEDLSQYQLSVAPMAVGGSVFVPLRSVAEALGIKVGWDSISSSVQLSKNGYVYVSAAYSAVPAPTRAVSSSLSRGGSHTFYFQNQADWNLPSYGSGYCWTVCYAMLITDVTGRTVTPVDVAEVNKSAGGSGSYCSHWDIADAFGVEFVSALDTSSPYYGGRDSNSGGTRLSCSGEYETVQALKEAIDRNPVGVMVRYSDYPHTMVAVGYEGDTILFNEPMQISRSYESYSPKENIPFEETCVAQRGYDIEDLSYIQALAVK